MILRRGTVNLPSRFKASQLHRSNERGNIGVGPVVTVVVPPMSVSDENIKALVNISPTIWLSSEQIKKNVLIAKRLIWFHFVRFSPTYLPAPCLRPPAVSWPNSLCDYIFSLPSISLPQPCLWPQLLADQTANMMKNMPCLQPSLKRSPLLFDSTAHMLVFILYSSSSLPDLGPLLFLRSWSMEQLRGYPIILLSRPFCQSNIRCPTDQLVWVPILPRYHSPPIVQPKEGAGSLWFVSSEKR